MQSNSVSRASGASSIRRRLLSQTHVCGGRVNMFLYMVISFWIIVHLVITITRVSHSINHYHPVIICMMKQKFSGNHVDRLLMRHGFKVKFFQLRFSTDRFNRCLTSFASNSRWTRALSLWFQSGAVVALILVPVSMFIMTRSLLSSFRSETGSKSVEVGLTAALPGVNLPISEIGFYLMAIICASVIHEAGHAVAAAHADVQVDDVGFAIIAVIPVAFVELATESFCRADVRQRLRIVCAGVWHNVVLALLCGLLLVVHPVILFPVCTFGAGATVISPSPGEKGLAYGDRIYAVNDCIVTGKETWRDCVSAIAARNLTGYCVTEAFLLKDRIHSLVHGKCCSEDFDRNLCFKDRRDGDFCLPARKVIDHKSMCLEWDDCPVSLHCLKPDTDNDRVRLFRVSRKEAQSYIFWGTGPQLLASVIVADFEVRSTWFPIPLIRFYDCLLRYLISFSLALAVLNVVPCFYLDGQFILTAAMEMVGGKNTQILKQTSRILLFSGTTLLLVSVSVAVRHLFFRTING